MITKGPWKWHKRKHSNTHFLASEDETNDDFAIIDDGSAYGEYGAVIDVDGDNAKLIAAAPELLEALRDLEYRACIYVNTSKAKSAIKKALGEEQ